MSEPASTWYGLVDASVKGGVTFDCKNLCIGEVSWAVKINTDVLITPQQVSLERENVFNGKA